MDSGTPESIDLELNIARALQAIAIEQYDHALGEYRAAAKEWRTLAAAAGPNPAKDELPPKPRPPSNAKIIEATKLATVIHDIKSKIVARDAISRSAVVDLVYRLQAHIRQYVPEQDRQAALLAAIQSTEVKE
jgi:hypothetical protein